MEIPVLYTSTAHAYGIEVPPPMFIIEEAPKVVSQSTLTDPSIKKWTGHGTAHQQRTKSTHHTKA